MPLTAGYGHVPGMEVQYDRESQLLSLQEEGQPRPSAFQVNKVFLASVKVWVALSVNARSAQPLAFCVCRVPWVRAQPEAGFDDLPELKPSMLLSLLRRHITSIVGGSLNSPDVLL